MPKSRDFPDLADFWRVSRSNSWRSKVCKAVTGDHVSKRQHQYGGSVPKNHQDGHGNSPRCTTSGYADTWIWNLVLARCPQVLRRLTWEANADPVWSGDENSWIFLGLNTRGISKISRLDWFRFGGLQFPLFPPEMNGPFRKGCGRLWRCNPMKLKPQARSALFKMSRCGTILEAKLNPVVNG